MLLDPIVVGGHFTVGFLQEDDGKSAPRDEFQDLCDTVQAALHVSFKRLADTGVIRNQEHFKKLEGTDLFEFKKFQHRFIGFYSSDKEFVICEYCQKKRDALPGSVVARAERLKKRWEEERACKRERISSSVSRTPSFVGSTKKKS